jgi:hypothetical protein
MLIKVDAEGKEAIKQLCDVALKFGGINNLDAINVIMSSVRPIEDRIEAAPTE